MESKITVTCPRCLGNRGHVRGGNFMPCIRCKTQGKVTVTSMAEKRRVEAAIGDRKAPPLFPKKGGGK